MGKRIVGFYWVPASDNLDQQLDLLVNTGANTVYVPYRKLDLVPLAYLHQQKIQVFVDWGLFVGEELRQQYPDSVPVDETGAPFERDDWYVPVCPNHPQVRTQHLAALTQLLEDHGHEIAGLWLDFIRFPVRWEVKQPHLRQLCFCRHCLNLFLQVEREHYTVDETQEIARLILHERKEEWVTWKCARITQFVQTVRRHITVRNFPLRLGMFSLPWQRTDYVGAIRTVAGQDLGLLAEHVDIISPMVYHKLCYRSVTWIEEVIDDVLDWTQRPVLPIIQSLDQPDVMTAGQLDAALTHASRASGDGIMIFTLDPLLAAQEKITVVRTHFSN
jgi:hypothetical protein